MNDKHKYFSHIKGLPQLSSKFSLSLATNMYIVQLNLIFKEVFKTKEIIP